MKILVSILFIISSSLALCSCTSGEQVTYNSKQETNATKSILPPGKPQKPDVLEVWQQATDAIAACQSVADAPECKLQKSDPTRAAFERDRIQPLLTRVKETQTLAVTLRSRYGDKAPDKKDSAIFYAVENLKLGSTWLYAAVEAEDMSRPEKAKVYLKGVELALDRAKKLLDGVFGVDLNDMESAIIPTSKEIEEADRAE